MATSGQQVIIVGTGETAAVAFEYFSHDSKHEVVAFSAERSYISGDLLHGRPVIPLDELTSAYSPNEYRTFVAVSMTGLNPMPLSVS